MRTPGDVCALIQRTDGSGHRQRTLSLAAAVVALLLVGPAGAAPETVHYGTSDGFAITADYYAPALPSARAVLILPDTREGRSAWIGIADSLVAAGLHVLVPDLRGTGESALQRGIRRDRARFTNGELQAARLDAEAGLRYLRELPATTIHEAALVCSGDADVSSFTARPGIMDRIARVIVSPAWTEESGLNSVRAGSVLVIVGAGDIIGIEASARLAAEDPTRECWLIDGAGRGAELLRTRPDLIPLLADWVGRTIGTP
jgi:pimeloyl-ACP methyl ester carboxylesterase